MGFWLFMVAMVLLIPMVMVGFGHSFAKRPPKHINATFGYRTARSMQNQDTWNFAHQYCGKIWSLWGKLLFLGSMLPMLLCLGKDISSISSVGLFVTMLQTLVAIATIFPVEAALQKNFDQFGNKL